MNHETHLCCSDAGHHIIEDMIAMLRLGKRLSVVLQFALECLVSSLGADRGVIWLVEGDQLVAKHEFGKGAPNVFLDLHLGSQESTAIVLEFLSRFPDESATGVMCIADTSEDIHSDKISPTLHECLMAASVKSRLLGQFRARGIFMGHVEFHLGEPKQWSSQEVSIVQNFANFASVVITDSFDKSNLQSNVEDMKLLVTIADLFRQEEISLNSAILQSAQLLAKQLGFSQQRVYLHEPSDRSLIAVDEADVVVDETDSESVISKVFQSGRGSILNADKRKQIAEEPFKSHMSLVLPLTIFQKKYGVLAMWERNPDKPYFRPNNQEMGLTLAAHLTKLIAAHSKKTVEHDVLETWIETLPMPLASILWRFHSEIDESRKVARLLKFFEAAAQFMSSISLSALRSDKSFYKDSQSRWISDKAEQNQVWRRSTFGSWITLGEKLQKITRDPVGKKPGKHSCLTLYRVHDQKMIEPFLSKDVWKIFRRVLDYRNKWHGHGGIPSSVEMKSRLRILEAELTNLKSIFNDGFRDWWLISVVESKSSYTGTHSHKAKKLMGSRTTFREVELQTSEMLHTDILYMHDPQANTPLPLIPFFRLAQDGRTEEYVCYFYSRCDKSKIEWVSYHSGVDADTTQIDSLPCDAFLLSTIKELEGEQPL